MISGDYQTEVDFAEAAKYWKLEKLYIDLSSAKGRGLTPLEKKLLQGLLCGYSPAEIALMIYKNPSSSVVRVYLSNGLYKYIKELLISQTGKAVKLKNWSRVTKLLATAGYKKDYDSSLQVIDTSRLRNHTNSNFTPVSHQNQDWEEKIELKFFFGRNDELSQLTKWVVDDRCRLVAVLGMGGLGKTALAVKLTEKIKGEFEFIIWRSLRGKPPIDDFLANLIQSLSPKQAVDLPNHTEAKISRLMSLLRSHRYLLMFNQFEEVLSSGGQAGFYEDGYQGYGELLRRLGQEQHSSCCLLTSREKPREIFLLEDEHLLVRSLQISGLNPKEAIELLTNQGLVGSDKEKGLLVNLYANNPLAIKMIAITIKNLFNRKITDFLANNTIILSNIRELLDEHFNRLSNLEQLVMYNLAVNHKLIELWGLSKELRLDISPRQQLEALESLQRRSLIESNSSAF
ncbi:MAG: NACHT domain-containing protein, partial [Moorea sp. SIO2B7]|nr:NACHT domain-containing protein [Moorena sp. SIO2B7]